MYRSSANGGASDSDAKKAEQERQAQIISELKAEQAKRDAERAAAAAEQERQRDAQIQAERAAAFDAEYKQPLLESWQRLGGTAADFEKQWPEISKDIRLEAAKREEAANREHFRRAFYAEL